MRPCEEFQASAAVQKPNGRLETRRGAGRMRDRGEKQGSENGLMEKVERKMDG